MDQNNNILKAQLQRKILKNIRFRYLQSHGTISSIYVVVIDSIHTYTVHRKEPPANSSKTGRVAVTVSIHIVTTHKEEPPANKYRERVLAA